MPRPLAFHPAVLEWFQQSFPGPTRAQAMGWPEILAGHSALVLAPTGSGKTLAAFLAAVDRIMFSETPAKGSRCRVVYVSPLRALAADVERNLRVPLAGIARIAERRGDRFHAPLVAVRTGDTPAAERARMTRTPPDILITTPESLFLVLTSNARAMLAATEVVIVDEIHALSGSKRGAHLALSLERLAELAQRPPQRIGLSATQRPLEEVARYLGGGRKVRIVNAGAKKAFEIKVEVPVEDMSRLGGRAAGESSIWPVIHPRLVELILSHRSTILFVNSRRLAERLAGALNELAAELLVRAHHGSIAREERLEIEDALKSGRLRAIVATSSLELGIDMGAVDLVVQIETPPSVASGMQRIGRGSHQAGAVSRGVIFPKYRGDLLSAAAIAKAMHEGAVEATRVPANPLDVLAQQLVAMAVMDERDVEELYALVRRSAPFAKLPRGQFDGVLDMLSGRYPSEAFLELRPRLTWDRRSGTLRARDGSRRLVVQNAGTIPDRGLYGVFLADGEAGGRRVGELDEEMVFESAVGDVFVLGASSWRIVEITRDRVLVLPAPGQPGRMPFWKGDRVARPVDLGLAIGRLTRELLALPRDKALARLVSEHALEPGAAENLLAYLTDQKQATGAVPDDRTLVLERTRDEMGDWRLCLLSPLGGRVHAPLALALEALLRRAGEPELESIWSDDGIVIRLPDRERPPDAAALIPSPEAVSDLVAGGLGGTALFAAHFREASARALLLPRRRPGQRTALWMQRKRAHDLLAVASRFPSFPMMLEAYRECLQDVFDVPALVELARRVERREVRLLTVDSDAPSPFAASLLFGYVANYLYDGDTPLAERRAQALVVDQRQLRELLGEAELRELLDPHVLAELDLALQALSPPAQANSADRLHDLLLRLGDLTRAEIAARCQPASQAADWMGLLERERRILPLTLHGEERLVAVEDAGRVRDAFGIPLPGGIPETLLAPVADAFDAVVARYAQNHGPFEAAELAGRYGATEPVLHGALGRLVAAGRLLEGEFRPGGRNREWCDPDVLATLRRRSLAALRKQVEPAEPRLLARLYLDWQGIATGPSAAPGSGPDALLDVIEQLQGAVIPASVLESDVLPALAEALQLLHEASPEPPGGQIHAKIRAQLKERGASFFPEIHAAAGAGLVREVLEALWDLVWAGEITNDTPAALRAFLRSHAPRSRERRPRPLSSFHSRRAAPPAAIGRWSWLAPVPASSTQRATARVEQLLARFGLVTRDAIAAESLPGGFAALYPVLAALEAAGRIRRGYFVAGLGGSQFAHKGAVERLRALAQSESQAAIVLAACDPANPYGSALPWPALAGQPMRVAGACVVLLDGRLVAYVARGAREITTLLPADKAARSVAACALARAIADWGRRTGRGFFGETTADGQPLARSVLAPFLAEAGFVPAGGGFRLG